MNPFDLPGPAFLVLYVLLGVAVVLGLRRAIRLREPQATDGAVPRLTDPFLIAYLRGGDRETISVALVSLIDRSLLSMEEGKYAVAAAKPDLFCHAGPIERAVLKRFAERGHLTDAYGNATILAACSEYRTKLEEKGLLIGESARTKRLIFCAIAATFLVVIAVVKIEVALARGHGNIAFLLFFAFAACMIIFGHVKGRMSERGEEVLSDIRFLFERLRTASNSQPG